MKLPASIRDLMSLGNSDEIWQKKIHDERQQVEAVEVDVNAVHANV